MSLSEGCLYPMAEDNDICGRTPVDAEGMCIFHSRDRNKSLEQFFNDLNTRLFADFTGFTFPVPVTETMFSDVLRGTAAGKTFKRSMIFKKAAFLKGVVLRDAVFEGSLDMTACEIRGDS